MTAGIPPELSVAVGGIQVTERDDCVQDTGYTSEFGQLLITGAMLSTATTEKSMCSICYQQ